jgi:hypothetical protein
LQWSEQQSVSFEQDLAYARHVAQFTPAKHVSLKQHPFAHDVALQTQPPLTHC